MTGGSRGIGAAVALRLAELGAPLVLVNSAGWNVTRRHWKDLTPQGASQVIDIDLKAMFYCTLAALPAMRRRGEGSFFFSNNSSSLRGRKRMTGQSLYYPRVMMRTLAQVLTEEYSEHGVHVANVVIDGLIDSPGTHALPRAKQNPEQVMNPVKIAEAFYYLHSQDRSVWTHELQLTPFSTKPSY